MTMDNQDAQSVTQEQIAAAIKATEYKYFGDYEMSDDQRDAVDVLVRVAQARLASQPTSAEDAVAVTRDWAIKLATLRQGQRNTPRCEPPVEREIQWATKDIKEVLAASPPLYTRPTPDTQTAAIGAEAEDTRLVCEQCAKVGMFFCDHVSRGAAYLSQPVAAPQAEIAGGEARLRALVTRLRNSIEALGQEGIGSNVQMSYEFANDLLAALTQPAQQGGGGLANDPANPWRGPLKQYAAQQAAGEAEAVAVVIDMDGIKSAGFLADVPIGTKLYATPQPTETQRIVAWLRNEANGSAMLSLLQLCANAIERGEHLAGDKA